MSNSDKTSHDNIPEEPLDSQFDWLANIYTRHGAINHPSELHGLMMGELVGNLRRTSGDWLQQVLEHMGVEALDEERYANASGDLLDFYQKSVEGIDRDSSAFELLLPDDDYQLPERIDSLVLWVRGFLEGLAVSASDRLQKIDAELQEILKDFVEICQLDSRVEQDESSEKEFVEIVEYVRIGVLNLYAELNEPQIIHDDSQHKDSEKDHSGSIVHPSSGGPTLH